MSARLPIVTKRRLTRNRRRADWRKRVAPWIVFAIVAAESVARFASYDYAAPTPDPVRDHARLAGAMSWWGAST